MRKLLDMILNGAGFLSSVLTVIVTLLLLYEVATRWLGQPSMWALDFAMYSICYLTFLGAAWVQREEGNVRVEIITQLLNPKYRALVMGVTSVVGGLSCTIFCWLAATETLNTYFEQQFIDGSIRIPRFLVIGIMPLGLCLLCLELFREAWQHFEVFSTGGKDKPKQPEEFSL